jgi:hypothetical protein
MLREEAREAREVGEVGEVESSAWRGAKESLLWL